MQELGACELAYMMQEQGLADGIGGEVPRLPDPVTNLNRYRSLAECIRQGWVRTAHDCSEGGLAVAVSEMCIGGRLGATIDIDGTGEGDVWGRMWGESLGRIVVAVSEEHEPRFTFNEGPPNHGVGRCSQRNLISPSTMAMTP